MFGRGAAVLGEAVLASPWRQAPTVRTMSLPFDPTVLADEVADLRRRVEYQAAELAAVRKQLPAEAVSRRHLLRGLAGLGAAGAASVVAAQPARADDGDPLLLGQVNSSTTRTWLQYTGSEIGLVVSSDGSTSLFASALEGADSAIHAVHLSTAHGVSTIQSEATDGKALFAINDSTRFSAVAGHNQGEGPGMAATTEGDGGQLVLRPLEGSNTGPPTTGPREVGEIRLDGDGDLWVCVSPGSPGTWTRLLREDATPGRVIPITPIRAIDTRATGGRPAGSPAVPGQKKGPLVGGTSLTLDLAGVAPIPTSATGVVGNLSVVSPNYAGYLAAHPSGTPGITSTLNFTAGLVALSNAFTTRLGPDGLTIRASGNSGGRFNLVIDITAYIT